MDFLTQQNKRVAGDPRRESRAQGTISAKGKHVVVIGGGDTGSDCIGTSNRQGALSVTQLEILAQPPVKENKIAGVAGLAAQAAHLVFARKKAASATGRCRPGAPLARTARSPALECVRVDWKLGDGGKMNLVEVPGSEFTLKADLVLLAMGFVGPRKQGLVEQARSGAGRARQRQGRHADQLQDQRGQGLLPVATCAAASRWWSGRSAKAANAPGALTSS